MRKVKKAFESKRDEIDVKEEKIDFFEQNYTSLIAELKREAQNRENLISEYQSMEKEMKREELAEMIKDIKKRAKNNSKTTQQKIIELQEIKKEISELEEGLEVKNMEIVTMIGEGENKKKKNDNSFYTLKNTFNKLLETFERTKYYMEKFIDIKMENKILEERVMRLKENKYRETTEKLNEELKLLAK